ncbi:MAG: hypothetical protein IJV34_07255 [Prevotella sp.]|nr:hypothetical protein [Prevotella sp.]
MLYVLIVITICSIIFAVWMMLKAKAAIHDSDQLKAVVDNQDGYTFLVNSGFEVEKSNVPLRTDAGKERPNVLGNVLRCKNVHDKAVCGETMACRSCPVRFVISKSFERGSDFSGLEASMELYDKNEHVVDVDVQVEGHYVKLNEEDHMVVNVKDVTKNPSGAGVPKVLFASENVGLFDKVRRALAPEFRVLNAEDRHQALHRMKLASDYKFRALLLDEQFYQDNQQVTDLLAENSHIPVFVLTEQESLTAGSDVWASNGKVTLLPRDFDPQQLRQHLL